MKRGLSFTLVEVLVVLIVLAVLAAIAIPMYQNRVEQIRQDICAAHEGALLEAIKIYDMKNDAMPDIIAKAWNSHGDEALAIVWERKKKEKDYIYLAYMTVHNFKLFLADIFSFNQAYAHGGRHPHLSGSLADQSMLKCPSDTNGPPSYAINAAVVNMRYDNIAPNTIIVAESDTGTFSVGGFAKIAPGPMPVVPPPFANRHNGGYISSNASGTVVLTTPAGVIVLNTGGGN